MRAATISSLALACALCFIFPMQTAAETQQAQQRQAARDVRQGTRQNARATKQNCVASDQMSNSACRQNKRGTKQKGREAARDIKY